MVTNHKANPFEIAGPTFLDTHLWQNRYVCTVSNYQNNNSFAASNKIIGIVTYAS